MGRVGHSAAFASSVIQRVISSVSREVGCRYRVKGWAPSGRRSAAASQSEPSRRRIRAPRVCARERATRSWLVRSDGSSSFHSMAGGVEDSGGGEELRRSCEGDGRRRRRVAAQVAVLLPEAGLLHRECAAVVWCAARALVAHVRPPRRVAAGSRGCRHSSTARRRRDAPRGERNHHGDGRPAQRHSV